MKDFSNLLKDKTQTIIDNWVIAVRQDKNIVHTNHLPRLAIENHIDHVLMAMATVLSQYQENDVQPIKDASLEHGSLRAEQGFEAAEIAREYQVLRNVIFNTLEPELLQASAKEVIRAIGLINIVLDEALAYCFQSYTEKRLSELEQLQNQLFLNNQELTRLVRTNQENISFLAHELRSPLTSIIGYSDLFLRQQQKTEVKESAKNVEHIERVLISGRKLLRLINDTLEISRCDAGQMKIEPELTNVCELVYDVYKMLEPLIGEKNLQISIDCSSSLSQVITDPLRLQQIVTNLVSNAIRYTQLGKIEINCHKLDNKKWAIAVSDTGIGIEKESQSQIFQPYFRVATEQKSYLHDSTGLGLAIVSRLVKLLHGKIEVVSQVGVGSTFTVTLPLQVES